MSRATRAGTALVIALVVIGALVGLVRRDSARPQRGSPAPQAAVAPAGPAAEAQAGFIYGRITTAGGTVYEGRLRWGGDQEAFWNDFFDGAKGENHWAEAEGARQHSPIEIFGIEFGGRDRRFDRQFMARFGDIAQINAEFGSVQVTLKSGTQYTLDRFAAGDIDDGVRVWDSRAGVVDLDSRDIRAVQFLPTRRLAAAPERLHGIVRTQHGEFSGYIQWHQRDCVGSDTLDGHAGGSDVSVRYDTIRSIARQSRDTALITLRDGRAMAISDRDVGHTNRGLAIDDPRYGRVQIAWDEFDRLEFTVGDSGPGYGDFPPGQPLTGRVTTRDGRDRAGRLVYDFDESETTETLDAGLDSVTYYIPFSLIATIVPHHEEGGGTQRPVVILHGGKELQLGRTGDLAAGNTGLLIFSAGRDRERPEHVRWRDVERVDFDPTNSAARGAP